MPTLQVWLQHVCPDVLASFNLQLWDLKLAECCAGRCSFPDASSECCSFWLKTDSPFSLPHCSLPLSGKWINFQPQQLPGSALGPCRGTQAAGGDERPHHLPSQQWDGLMQELSSPVAQLMCVVNDKDGVIIAGTDLQRTVPAGFECSCPSLCHQSFPTAGTYAEFLHVPDSMRTGICHAKVWNFG